jgi:hypothetical protein
MRPAENVCRAQFMLQYLLALDVLAETGGAEDRVEAPKTTGLAGEE